MKKFIVLLMVVCFSLIGMHSNFAYAYNPNNEEKAARKKAEDALGFIKGTIESNRTGYGFKPEDDLSKISLSKGYRVLLPDVSKLDTTDNLISISKDINTYNYILYVDKEPRAVLKMGKTDADYILQSFGYCDADVIDKKLKYLDEYKKDNNINNETILIEIKFDTLLVCKDKAKEIILPAYATINDSDKSFVMKHNDFLSTDYVKERMKKNLKKKANEKEIKYGGLSIFDFKAEQSHNEIIYSALLISIVLIFVITIAYKHNSKNRSKSI